jgi:outer membrane protein TolC
MNIMKILLMILLAGRVYALDIDEAIKSTIENNPKVKIAIEKLNESKELIIFSRGAKLPLITGSISGTYKNSNTSTSTTSSTAETLTDVYKLTITQNLYDSGVNDLEIER